MFGGRKKKTFFDFIQNIKIWRVLHCQFIKIVCYFYLYNKLYKVSGGPHPTTGDGLMKFDNTLLYQKVKDLY